MSPPPDPIADLRPFEEETRRSFDFERPPSAETGMGADPWSIRRVASGWVGILRGRAALVLLDDELHELARVSVPRSPTGLAVGKNGEILVASELSPMLGRFAVRGHSLEPLGDVRIPGVLGLRDVTVSPAGVVWALDERGGQLLQLALGASDRGSPAVASHPVGHGAVQVIATARHVVVNATLEHTLFVLETDALGVPLAREPLRITHDGPMWGFDARETSTGLVIAAGGVEDHPLDRTSGFFGYIDSFAFVYRVHDAIVEKLASVNVSEHGVVTPKAIAIETADAEHVELLATAYGSATGVTIGVRGAGPRGRAPAIATVALVPGIRALERSASTTVMADPLLDAWVLRSEHGVRVVPVAPGPAEPVRSAASRLGEALFFTSLMAPKNTSTGALSRFTCETCHFEGYVDGRTHHTGREEIHATTKPLVGLVGNRPYFSRALDPDLSTVSHAEFRVAGAGSSTDPFFAVEPRDHAWLEHIGVRERVEPLELRRALMRFLIELSHRPSSSVASRVPRTFDDTEREGAALFRDKCESCHAARLSADDVSTQVPFERWESLVTSDAAPIVWGSAGYEKTGVVPYVHEEGARTPSLRRLYKKYPYFTNGSAKSLDEVLSRLRFTPARTLHGTTPANSTALSVAEKRSLKSFLELL
ncbi:MAG: hypothetical protein JWP87_6483 [Labilithrix sp.]|nr:hypothetical protein [Labilithrix sp.]